MRVNVPADAERGCDKGGVGLVTYCLSQTLSGAVTVLIRFNTPFTKPFCPCPDTANEPADVERGCDGRGCWARNLLSVEGVVTCCLSHTDAERGCDGGGVFALALLFDLISRRTRQGLPLPV